MAPVDSSYALAKLEPMCSYINIRMEGRDTQGVMLEIKPPDSVLPVKSGDTVSVHLHT